MSTIEKIPPLEIETDHIKDDISTTKKEDYQIAVCQNGKFAVTFDAGKFQLPKTIHLLFNEYR